MVSIFDDSGIEAIKKLKVSSIKIPSGEINNYPLLKKVSKLKKILFYLLECLILRRLLMQ